MSSCAYFSSSVAYFSSSVAYFLLYVANFSSSVAYFSLSFAYFSLSLHTFCHTMLTFRQAVAAAVCSLHSGRWWWWWLCAGEAAGRHYPKTDTSLTSNEETVPASLQKISTGSELLFNIKKFPIKKLKQTTV